MRPVVEYASNAYHCLLNEEQSDFIESLQFNALRMIFGRKYMNSELLAKTDIPRLSDRRVTALENFSRKIEKNQRFRDL